MQKGKKIAEGKTKVIWEDPADSECVLIESKDDITAGDGAQRDELEGKAVAATSTTCNVFYLLNRIGVPTHYRQRIGERMFQAAHAEMIPLECVVRRVATGSYLKRNPEAVEGEIFDDLVFEIFHKDDDNHDPILVFAESGLEAVRFPADQPEGDRDPIDMIGFSELGLRHDPERMLERLAERTKQVFLIIEEAWAKQDVQLVDLKIEFGWVEGPVGPKLVVADVIDNDSWRIWPGGDKTQMKDKQVYRDLAGADDPKAKAKELGQIKKNYRWVAEATGKFV